MTDFEIRGHLAKLTFWHTLKAGQDSELVDVVDAILKQQHHINQHRQITAQALPRLPPPRLLGSGVIAGKLIELHGWHTEDLEIWRRQHNLVFKA